MFESSQEAAKPSVPSRLILMDRPEAQKPLAAALPRYWLISARRPISTTIPFDRRNSTKERVMHELGDKSHWHEPTGDQPRRLRQVRPAQDALRPVHGVGRHPDLPRHRREQGAEPAAGAVEAHGRQAAPTSSSTAPKANGAATWSRCRARARSMPKSTSTRKSIYVVEGRGTDRSVARQRHQAPRVRVAEGLAVLDPGQRLAPHRQCKLGAGAAARRHHGAEPDEPRSTTSTPSSTCPTSSSDRFSGADDFYKYKDDIEPDPVRGLAMRRTNFIPDIVNCDLPLDNRRSPGWRRVEPFMTGNTFYLWIGQHENGRYSKAHAHTSAAVLICLKGKGYTYTWPERLGVTPWKDGKADQIKRVDYEPVGMVSAAPGGARWYPPAFRRLEGPAAAHRLVRPAQSRPRARPARREAHRLHRHGHPRGRQRDPVLDGRPVSSARNTTPSSRPRASRTAWSAGVLQDTGARALREIPWRRRS